MMAAVMDLDLNCSPPSPEPVAQDDLTRSMLRHQVRVKDLHRMYWAHTPLTDVPPPFWKQPQPSHMVNCDDTGVFSHCYGQVKQRFGSYYNEAAGDNLGVKGPVWKIPEPPNAQGMMSSCRYVIDLEKSTTLDDDAEIVSSQCFVNYGTCNGSSQDNSQCVPPESSPVMGDLCKDHNTPYTSHGSSGSSDTAGSGRVCFDLNVVLEDDSNIYPDSSKVLSSLLASSATRNSEGCCSNPRKTFHNGSESSTETSKGSCVTVAATISAPDGVREAMADGLFSYSTMPFCAETPKYDALVRGDMHHQKALDKKSRLDFQGDMEIPRISSVSSHSGNKSPSGMSNPGDKQVTNLTRQLPVAMHREPLEDAITLMSDTDSEMAIFDLNIPVESIGLPAKVESNYVGEPVNSCRSEENSCVHYFTQNEGQQNISSVEFLTSRSHHMAKNKVYEDVQSPGSGNAVDRYVLIPETPQGRDYACPRLSSPSNVVSIQLETVCIHEANLGEDERIDAAATAAETLVSIFATNSAWMTDRPKSNSQTDPPGGNHKPLLSLDSFEESILNLEEMKDDGESTPVRPPDKDTQSCRIKLKRGRGLRNFQREILPGLVSLARHEICDDLHAIGYEIRKTRSRRSSGEQGTRSMRTRLPRRCSTAWNQ